MKLKPEFKKKTIEIELCKKCEKIQVELTLEENKALKQAMTDFDCDSKRDTIKKLISNYIKVKDLENTYQRLDGKARWGPL